MDVKDYAGQFCDFMRCYKVMERVNVEKCDVWKGKENIMLKALGCIYILCCGAGIEVEAYKSVLL